MVEIGRFFTRLVRISGGRSGIGGGGGTGMPLSCVLITFTALIGSILLTLCTFRTRGSGSTGLAGSGGGASQRLIDFLGE